MKVLVTGTAGFIGFHLAQRLLERGDTVVGIDNINDYYDVRLKYARLNETGISQEAENWHKPVKSNKYPNYTFIRTNLEDKDFLMELFKKEKFDKVCNLAAQAGVRYSLENPDAYISSNIVGFINILEACRYNNIDHLVYASSSSVYGNNTKMPLSIEDNVDHPISLYAATKKSNELMAHTYSHLFKLPTTGLRFFTVYGPWGRPDMALFLFTKAIITGQPIKLFNYGNMVRDFTYVDDVVEGVMRVIDNPPMINSNDTVLESAANIAPYKIYNIGNSTPVQILEYIKMIESTLGTTTKKVMYPMQPGDVPYTEADVKDLETDIGFKPKITISEGVPNFVKWYTKYFSNVLNKNKLQNFDS